MKMDLTLDVEDGGKKKSSTLKQSENESRTEEILAVSGDAVTKVKVKYDSIEGSLGDGKSDQKKSDARVDKTYIVESKDGKLVVTRTRDGGKSFDVLTRGLPQEHAYDLVFRHALDVDATGRRLVFGSTTGSLWVSEDEGDSWACVSTHLPPVYCARFAT